MAGYSDGDSGSELFSSYEAELKLIQASLNDKLDQIPDLTGEARKAAVRQAQLTLEEATELVPRPPISSPSSSNILLSR